MKHFVRLFRWAALIAVAAAGFRCASEPPQTGLIDPDAIGSDQGTLVSIADIRTVAGEMVQSMSGNPALARLRAAQHPLRISVGNIKQRTSIAIFDKEVFVNRLLGSLNAADTDGAYTFLRREDVPQSEQGGTSPGAADLVLSGELRELLHRSTAEGGGESEQRTVQYSLRLTRVDDSTIVWTDSREVVKQQITGAVYQ